MIHQRNDASRGDAAGKVVQPFSRDPGLHKVASNALLLALLGVGRLVERDDDATRLHHRIRACKCFTADQIENGIHRLDHSFKTLLGEVDDTIGSQPKQGILLPGLRRGRDVKPGFMGDLNRQGAYTTGTTLQEYGRTIP